VDKIVIQKKNESMMLIGCDWGIGAELSDFFSFFVPGYKFMPLYKNKIWDGKVRLYNAQTNELGLGLLPYVKEFAEKRNYTIEYEDSLYGMPEQYNDIDPKAIMDFLKRLNLQGRGEPIEVRDYQFDAICDAIRKKRAILLSPTGSGKSLIIYALMRWYLENFNQKVLVIVPTTSLVQQMYADFADYSTADESFQVEKECHVIYSGKEKTNIHNRIYISTWQSIYKLGPAWFEQFGAVFGDECHGFKSKSLTAIMNKARLAAYRFGTTGTLDGTQTHKLTLEGLFGKVKNVTTTKTLQDKNTLAQLDINLLTLQYKEETKKILSGQSYQEEINFIVTNEKRNKFISNLSLSLDGNTLVLYQFVEKHGKPLHTLIANKADEKRKIFFVSGGTEASDREAIRKIVETQKDAIIVASLGTFSTGINIRNLHNIVFASPSKSQIRILQSIGRGLRKSENGKTTQLYDIADNLKYKSKKNYSLVHAEERLKIYKREQFNCKIHMVDLNE